MTHAQGTGQISSLLTRSGFVMVSRFFSIHFTISATWAKNIVPYKPMTSLYTCIEGPYIVVPLCADFGECYRYLPQQ